MCCNQTMNNLFKCSFFSTQIWTLKFCCFKNLQLQLYIFIYVLDTLIQAINLFYLICVASEGVDRDIIIIEVKKIIKKV